MIAWIKHYKKIISILLLPYLAVLFVFVYPTNYSITAPGGVTEVEQFIVIDGIDLTPDIYTVHVYAYHPITLFQSLILKADKTMDIAEITDYESELTLLDQYNQGQISKEASLVNSLISSYELASEIDQSISISYHFEGLTVYSRPSRIDEVKIGDHVIAVNGLGYEDATIDDYRTLLAQDSYTLTIERNDETFDYTYQKEADDIIFSFYSKYVIDQAQPTYEFTSGNQYVGGPSGGLMQALAIYTSLVNINTEQLKIAGTGTISTTGNVGQIGGLLQKYYTVVNADIDLFFIPNSQVDDLSSITDFKVNVIPVSTLREAVNALNEYLD